MRYMFQLDESAKVDSIIILDKQNICPHNWYLNMYICIHFLDLPYSRNGIIQIYNIF